MPTNTFKVGEMLNRRTRNSKTWLNFDGSYTTEVHMGDVHFDDEYGNLHNINTDLYDEADFDIIDEPVSKEVNERFKQSKKESKEAKAKGILNRDNHNFQALRVPFVCHIPRNFMRGYTIGKGDDMLIFKPVNASPAMGYIDSKNRSIITYQDVWNDTDVQLKILDSGIKESIFLKSDRSPNSFSFEVVGNIDSLTELKLSDAWLVDAEGTERDVEQIIRTENNKSYVDLITDVEGLAYPIEIDPTTIISSTSKDSYISESSSSSNNGTNSQLYAGGSVGYRYRTYMQWDISGIPGSKVTDSYFTIYGLPSTSVNPDDYFDVYRVTQSWGETSITWDNQASYDNVYGSEYISTFGTDYSASFNITNLVDEWVSGATTNNGCVVLGRNNTGEALNWQSKEHTDLKPPKLTVTYNESPTAPTVTAPNGGETWNSSHTVTWNASTDAETAQSNLQYQIQLSTDNGSSWKDIVALTTAGATSYTYDFINETESSTCLIRIRAYDGTSYGPWDQSDGVFTIQHNQAPTAPTNLSPSGGTAIDRAVIQRLSWQHNDADGDPQSKFDLQWSSDGGTNWNTVTQVTTNQYWDAPANTFPKGNIVWKVRTYDQADLSSPYSSQATFYAGDKPADPTITDPSDGSTVNVVNPTVEWSSSGQTDYHLKVMNSAGSSLLWETIKTSTNKAQTVQYDLENTIDYQIHLAIKNADGLWSDFVVSNISVSYTPPATPTMTLTTGDSYIVVAISNPTPSGSEPSITGNDVYKKIDGAWVRIASDIPNSGSYRDYAIASGVTYEYKVRAKGDNNTTSDSASATESITLTGVWLHDIQDPQGTVHQFKADGGSKGKSSGKQGQMLEFAGRKKPVSEFTELKRASVKATLELWEDTDDYQKLQSLFESYNTICYRDRRGRILFGSIFNLGEEDQPSRYIVSEVEVLETDYTEKV